MTLFAIFELRGRKNGPIHFISTPAQIKTKIYRISKFEENRSLISHFIDVSIWSWGGQKWSKPSLI